VAGGDDLGHTGRRPSALTLLDLARDLGVSRATVSNAYNHPDQLSVALRRRILERAAELGFAGPNPLARGLRRHRVGAVGVLFGEALSYAFADPAAVVLLDGLAQTLETDRIALLLVAGGDPASPDTARVTDAAVDGWVLFSLEEGSPMATAALARHEPVVVLDQPALDTPRVEVDDAGGTRLAAAHLLALGHRHLVVLGLPCNGDGRTGIADRSRQDGATFAVTRRRLAGVRAAVADSGSRSVRVTVVECAHNDPATGQAALAPWLRDPTDRPTGVVAMSDQLAFGAIRAAREAGLAVPADLSVVGFDDVTAATMSEPPLTTVRQPLELRGRTVGGLVLDLLHGRPPPEVTTFAVELVVRASTAPPPPAGHDHAGPVP
jgi:DNA-binding LacI/PurR family transcriptional regulator